MPRYPFQKQFDQADCGPACLKMITEHFGQHYTLDLLREMSYVSRDGVSLPNLEYAAQQLGFETYISMLSLDNLVELCPLPCILHWNQNHFIVLYKIFETNDREGHTGAAKKFLIADPAHGLIKVTKETFIEGWLPKEEAKGVVLALELSKEPLIPQPLKIRKKLFLLSYLFSYKKYVIQIIFGMILTSITSLAFPLLTKVLIDKGVGSKNIGLVVAILCSQLFLFIGTTVIGMIRSWLVLHVNARISLTIISDFLSKLLKLPLSFFDSRTVGDITQRINDHHRIEAFLTSSLLGFVFSLFNIIIFTAVIAFYNLKILAIFSILSGAAILWVFLFQKRRKEIDYRRFSRGKENNNKLYEIVTGINDVKLFGAEARVRSDWEDIQLKSFKLNLESLKVEQYQISGLVFFNQLKNILVSFISAYEVINGNISLGTLLSISYIIGQTNGPLDQVINFVTAAQDAKLSMDRLQEINEKEDEEKPFMKIAEQNISSGDIVLSNVSFQYEGPKSPLVIKNINIRIPKGKITAIVGSSGSGKSTLLKLLLKYYHPASGEMYIDGADFSKLSPKSWRMKCGTVLQDGFVFDDSIEKNIAIGDDEIPDRRLVDKALQIAHLNDFVDGLPLGSRTKIGASGIGLSGGQKQRLFIARAVYKDPDFIFFDEATSNLDANSEKKIVDNLNEFFIDKTVIIVAHRLSTVKNADQILVLEDGQIIEQGVHRELVNNRGKYWELVRNQLELE